MDEYIERETIKAAMIHYGFKSQDMTVTEFVEDELPAADVAPVQHGRWTMRSDRPDTIICSCCDSAFDVWKADIKRHHYCPNCGAKMDGAE